MLATQKVLDAKAHDCAWLITRDDAIRGVLHSAMNSEIHEKP